MYYIFQYYKTITESIVFILIDIVKN